MKIKLTQMVSITGDSFPMPFNKEFENTIIPFVGATIFDSVWKDPSSYDVTHISIDYQEDRCYVTLEPLAYSVDLAEYSEMAAHHGWYCPLNR